MTARDGASHIVIVFPRQVTHGYPGSKVLSFRNAIRQFFVFVHFLSNDPSTFRPFGSMCQLVGKGKRGERGSGAAGSRVAGHSIDDDETQ